MPDFFRPSLPPLAWIASAPGRLEILGNHTDYNEGWVLSCAVGQRTTVTLGPSPTNVCRLVSSGFPGQEVAFTPANAQAIAGEKHWGNYCRGVVCQLQERGVPVPPFTAVIDSDLPRSAGMSSSAALEVALTYGLLALTDRTLPPETIAHIGQAAESLAVGARTGLMDQLTSCLGKRGHLVCSEYRTLSAHRIAMPEGYVFVVVDSGEKHDLTTEYNDRRAACERAAAVLARLEPGIKTLRDVSATQLAAHSGALGADLPFARHVVEENERVAAAENLLLVGDVAGFGRLLFASHDSSVNHFNNSSVGQDRLIALARADARCLGARLSGGGFGGVTIHLVRAADAQDYARDLAAAAKKLDGRDHWHTVATLGDGPSVVRLTQPPPSDTPPSFPEPAR